MRGEQGGRHTYSGRSRRPGRAIGQDRGGHGPDQRGHARGGEEPLRHGEVLRHLRAAVQQGRVVQRGRRHMEGQRRWQGGEQPAAAGNGRAQRHRPAGRVHRQDNKRRARRRDGGEHGSGEHDDRQPAQHGARHGLRAAEPEQSDRPHQPQGRIERNEDNAREPARARAAQVNSGGTHTTTLTHYVSWSPPAGGALSSGCSNQPTHILSTILSNSLAKLYQYTIV